MSSSSSNNPSTTTTSSSSSSSTNTPYQQAYYGQALQGAQGLYEQGLPDYYGGQTVAGHNQAQQQSFDNTTGYMNGKYNQLQDQTFGALSQGLSGNIDTRGFDQMSDMYQNQAQQGASDMMNHVRGGATNAQPGGGGRQDMLTNQVIDESNQQYSNNMAGLYNNAYQTAQQNQMQSMGMANNIMQNPMQMNKQLFNQVGLPQQQLQQQQFDDDKARYDYESGKDWQNLAQYQNMISGDMGGTSTSGGGGSSTTTQSGGPNQRNSTLGGIAGGAIGNQFGQQALGTAAGGFFGGLL